MDKVYNDDHRHKIIHEEIMKYKEAMVGDGSLGEFLKNTTLHQLRLYNNQRLELGVKPGSSNQVDDNVANELIKLYFQENKKELFKLMKLHGVTKEQVRNLVNRAKKPL